MERQKRKEKFKTKKEAYKRTYDLLPIEATIYKGHRSYIVEYWVQIED